MLCSGKAFPYQPHHLQEQMTIFVKIQSHNPELTNNL